VTITLGLAIHNETETAMDKLAEQFAELAAKYEPHVINAALGAARMEAYSWLAAAAMWVVVGSGMAYAAFFLFKKIIEDNWDDFLIVPASILGLAAFVALCSSLWVFIDPWTWTAINQPELWIAKRALKL